MTANLPGGADDDQLYTLVEVAKRFKNSVRTLRRWISEGRMKAHKMGRTGAPRAEWRVSETEIQRLLKAGLS